MEKQLIQYMTMPLEITLTNEKKICKSELLPSRKFSTTSIELESELIKILIETPLNIWSYLDTSALTPFQQNVYKTLLATPIGQQTTYKQLSIDANLPPNSARAVGTAMANNPFVILVPCHRVIRSDGYIGQYSGGDGQSSKKALLKYEHQYSSAPSQ